MFLTYEEYKNIVGTQLEEAQFTGLATKAADIISSVCRFFYLTDDDLTNDKFQWRAEKFKHAIAYQVEYMAKNGYNNLEDISAATVTAQSVSMGRTSISGMTNGGTVNSQQATAMGLSETAYMILKSTGLLYRGVNVL